MSTSRRPQRGAEPGQRVVLVIARGELGGAKSMQNAVDEVARLGWIIAAIIDPAHHLQALQMVLDGLADVVLATRAEHMPTLRFVYDLSGTAGGSKSVAHTDPVQRPQPQEKPAADHPWRSPSMVRPAADEAPVAGPRRPQLLDGDSAGHPVQRRSQPLRRPTRHTTGTESANVA